MSKPVGNSGLRLFFTSLFVVGAFGAAIAWAASRTSTRAQIQPALKGIEQRLKAKGRAAQVLDLKRGCQKGECDCVARSSSLALDLDAAAEALAMLDAAGKRCADRLELPGVRAEALVRAGKRAEGVGLADQTLKARPKDAYSLMALALAHRASTSGAVYAAAAEQAGRGSAALRLRGLMAYEASDLRGALALFEQALKLDPNDLEALYNRALIFQRLGRYYEAREGYLRALAIDPRFSDARYNLALLTHRAGATAEAQHHLSKLRELRPDPSLLRQLEQLLARSALPQPAAIPSSAALPAPGQ